MPSVLRDAALQKQHGFRFVLFKGSICVGLLRPERLQVYSSNLHGQYSKLQKGSQVKNRLSIPKRQKMPMATALGESRSFEAVRNVWWFELAHFRGRIPV